MAVERYQRVEVALRNGLAGTNLLQRWVGIKMPLQLHLHDLLICSHVHRLQACRTTIELNRRSRLQEYFADGMVEEIITALSRFKALFVIARNSSFTYRGRAVDVRQVGRELGVRYVLEGSVRKAANRVRITGQLVDTATGAHLWADHFDGTLEDIFDLQDQLTAAIVGAIAPRVEQAEIERTKRKPTDRLDAYDYYLRGLPS